MKSKQSRYIAAFILIIFFLFAVPASAQTTVDVKYLSCSNAFDCNGFPIQPYPVRFVLPQDHGAMEFTLVTTYAYAFMKSMSDALYTPPSAYNYLNDGINAAIDLLSSGINFLVNSVIPQPGVYDFVADRLAAAISGQKLASYHVMIVNYDGSTERLILPIGRTTLLLSDRIQYVDVCSFVEAEDMLYKTGEVYGKVAYDNAREIE